MVKYTTEVYFKGISEPVILPAESTNSDININIGKLGLIDVNFLPHPILSSLTGDNEIRAIQVDVSYKDETDPDHFTDTLVLKTDKPEGEKMLKIMGKIIDAPLHYKATYFSKDGSSVEIPEKKYYLTENNTVKVLVPSPYQDTLELSVELPQVPDESVKKIIVEFRYEDLVNHFSSTDKIELSAEDDWEPASSKLVLIDKTQAKFQYRYRIISTDAIAKSDWIDGEGDETLILPILKVNINASQLKLGTAFTNALLTLHYGEGTSKTTRELFLDQESAAKTITWYIPRTSTNAATFDYQLTLIKEDGTTVESAGAHTGSILILKAPVLNET